MNNKTGGSVSHPVTVPGVFFEPDQKCVCLQVNRCWVGGGTYLMLLASATAAGKQEVDEESLMDFGSGPRT